MTATTIVRRCSRSITWPAHGGTAQSEEGTWNAARISRRLIRALTLSISLRGGNPAKAHGSFVPMVESQGIHPRSFHRRIPSGRWAVVHSALRETLDVRSLLDSVAHAHLSMRRRC